MASAGTFSPTMSVPTLLDLASTPAKVSRSGGWLWESLNVLPARRIVSLTVKGVIGVTTPSSRAAAAVITLPVEPGS